MDLKGKTAIITGGKKGIGLAISKKLAEEGVNLAICSLNKTGLSEITEQLQNLNPEIKVLSVPVDVRQEKDIKEFVEKVQLEFKHIDILINNAGIAPSSSIAKSTETLWNEIIDTNLKGPYLFMKEVIPLMKDQGGGHIINIGSILSKIPMPGTGIYVASKFGLRGLSLSVKEEVRKYNIKVSLIYPGAVDTEIWNRINGKYDHNKMMKPDDIAITVLTALKLSNTTTIDELLITPQTDII